jgi:hypothetical protein
MFLLRSFSSGQVIEITLFSDVNQIEIPNMAGQNTGFPPFTDILPILDGRPLTVETPAKDRVEGRMCSVCAASRTLTSIHPIRRLLPSP